jgi:hypothetical protein
VKDLKFARLIGKIPLKIRLRVEFSKLKGSFAKIASHAHWTTV